MREQAAQRDFLGRRKLIVGNLPRFQNLVDVIVEGQAPSRDERQRRDSRDRLADRGRLEQRVVVHLPPGVDVRESPSLRPFNMAVVEDRDADSRHLQLAHPVVEVRELDRTPGDDHGRHKAPFDPTDPLRDRMLLRNNSCTGEERAGEWEETASH